ncbi:DEAD box ATP-dependent RNA helicase, putative [Schistosoma mansoni]|uniref:DEAD box ATP-dependent RNA helicase, putative n=1 Tax=Schistosoma mansoni TaxID=6183 RepID=UPI00022C81B2|nr:DEAD box ATP-dependent RNA helicase, putative [Schistosoma mansoni]|eukprot:XP_018646690.1 DEAD box ATP-dependent RNA helicase, putative [Schistosoma mansoni]
MNISLLLLEYTLFHVTSYVYQLCRKLSRNCQILLFSATYEDSVIDFAHEFVPNPIEFRVKRTQLPLKNIKQFYMCFSDWIEKYQALKDIYGGFEVGQAIIFCAYV